MSRCHDYLLARGVLPETAIQYGFEFDEHPTRERIIERLGLDRLYNGVPLSQAAAELLWASVDNRAGVRLLWAARVFLLPLYGEPDPKTLVTAKEDPNQHQAPFIWRPTWEHVRHVDVPLVVTEGGVKGLVTLQAGGFPIALHGVWMGAQQGKERKYELITEFDAFDLVGRLVHLAFDTDQRRNNRVLHALLRQAFLLFAQGAEVRQLTTWDPHQAKGLDDYLALRAGTNPELQHELLAELMDKAPPFFETLKPTYLPLVDRELGKVQLSAAQRSQLAKLIARPLGVRVGALDDDTKDAPAPETHFRLLEQIEPWPEPVDGAELLSEIHDEAVNRYVVLDPHLAVAVTMWIVLTYVYDLFYTLPILRIYSPDKQCGKSTLLDGIEQVAARPMLLSDPTNSALFRTTAKYHPSWLLDEAQRYVKPGTEISHYLDSCYQRGRCAARTNPNTMEVEFFDVFGCAAVASIKLLTDTVEDRGIHIRMDRKGGSKELPQLIDTLVQDPEYFLTLRRKLIRWTNDVRDKIKAARPTRPDFLWNRTWDKWRPFYILAQVAGGEWPKRVENCARVIVRGGETEVKSVRIEILSRLRPFFRERAPQLPADFRFLPTDEILKHLNSDDEAPWADDKAKSGKEGLTPEKLHYHLKEYQIKSQQKEKGGLRIRGYWVRDFEAAFSAYLPPEDLPPGRPPADDHSDEGRPDEADESDYCGASPDSGLTTKEAENRAHSHKQAENHAHSAEKGVENIIYPSPSPISWSQPEGERVSPSGSTIKCPQVDTFNPRGEDSMPSGYKRNPRTLDDSAATTYESPPRVEGLLCGGGACSILSEAEALTEFIRDLPSELAEVGLDIETYVPGKAAHSVRKDGARLGTALDWQAARIRLISLAIPLRGVVLIDLGTNLQSPMRFAVELLLEWLARCDELIGHNLRFDLCFLEREFGWRTESIWDTWIAAELLLNDDRELVAEELRPKKVRPGPCALVSILKADLGIDIDESLGGGAASDFGVDVLSPEQYAYAATDVVHLIAEADFQRSRIEQATLNDVARLEMQLVPIMAHMELVGIPLRADLLDDALERFKVERTAIETQIVPAMQDLGFDPYLDYSPVSKAYLQPLAPARKLKVNINGANLKQHYFEGMEQRLGLKLPRTSKAVISLKAEVLRPIDDPVAKLYADWLDLSTLIIGVEQRRKYIGADGRVHPVHDQLSANTGRISTSEPAMSNLPRAKKGNPLRHALAAPEGYVISQCDLSQIELRAQANHTGDPALVELFNLPPSDPRGDIYRLYASWMASELRGVEVPIEDIPAKGEARSRAKPVVLGSAYLMGLERFIQYAHDSYRVDFTRDEAQRAQDLYFQRFAGIKAWHEEARTKAQADLVSEGRTLLGRRRLVLAIEGDRKYRYRQMQAQVNFVIQGACADGLKLAIILIVQALPPGAELILTIHDELLVLCRAEQAEEVNRIVAKAVVAAYRVALGEPLKVPIIVHPVTLKNWSEK
jgi:putative DNA primase/helicase